MKNSLNFGSPIKLRELAADPADQGEHGGMYYNSNDVRFKIYENSFWDNIVSQTVLDAAISVVEGEILSAPSKLEWQNSVISILDTPAVGPATGDRYLIGTSPTGVWSSHANDIAEWSGSAWVYTVANTDFNVGTFVSVDTIAEGIYYWGGSSWTSKVWENPGYGAALDLDLTGGAPGVLNVLYDNSTIKVNLSNQLTVGIIGDSNITDNTISGAKLVVDSVDGTKLIDNSVNGVKLVYASVDGTKLIDNSVSYTKLNSDVWTYIQDSVVKYDDVTIGKNGSSQLYVKDNSITTAKLSDVLDTTTKAVKISGTNGLFVSKLNLFDAGDYAKYVEEVYEHGITLTDNTTAAVTEFGFDTASYHGEIVEYKISEGSKYRIGTLYVAGNSISDEFSENDALDVAWSAAGSPVVVSYTTATHGVDRTMNATVKKFIP